MDGTRPYDFVEEGKGAVITNCLRDPSLPHSPTHSTVQYIDIHPSPTTLHPPKYQIYSMRRPNLKSRDEMNDLIYKTRFYLQNVVCWGWEKKPRNENITRLVALPSPLLRYGARLFSGVRERRKQAGLTLSGRGIWSKGKKEKAGSGSVKTGRMNLLWWGSKIFRMCGLE